MNHVVVVGNLTRDPELRFTPSGQATASFGVADNSVWTDKDGQRQEKTSFFDVVAWGSLAENVATSLAKGSRVIVYGRLDQRSWETPEGDRRSKVEITANEVSPSLKWANAQVTKNPRSDGQNDTGYVAPPPAPAAAAPAPAPAAAAPALDEEPW